MALLTKAILNAITATLYTGASVAFFSVTPTAGETAIATLTEGFTFAREPSSRSEIDESDAKLYIADDAAITAAQLARAAAVEITANGKTTRYAIKTLLSQQQLGAGYVLRLKPQKGATG